jgi:3-hydroxyisobutyrate dehydrogenase-like beta-hydroxyacid dehydrogenase
MATAVGLVGTGMLGAPIARCLVEAGHDVTVLDRDEARARSVDGAHVARDLGDLVRRAQVVACCVDGHEAATEVALGSGGRNGVVHEIDQGATYVELTTMTIESVQTEARELEARGAAFVECPVSGRAPELTALLGGDPDAIEGIAGVLAAFTAHRFHLGDVGAATAAKLVNQYLTYANLMVAAHGTQIAARHGVAPTALVAALSECAAASRSLTLLGGVLARGGAGFGSVASILRDLDDLADLVARDGIELGPVAALHDLFAAAARDAADRPFPAALARYGVEA